MGIPGLFKEIGKGERIALSCLSVTHLEKHNRPIRIAIDAAIWNFQTQHGGVGGKNPHLRTLFYRLVKLLALPIDPVFVFDGKNKPLCKRGRTVSRWHGGTISDKASQRLISLFRFPCHIAPGEAEAECAMLQRHGVVDAVMTQDVDAIMFGSKLTLRDWSHEGKSTKSNGTPTHVSVFDLERLKEISGLDPEGMILVALLSGGDYDEGIAGIGISSACEIAKAGFGTDLLELVRAGDEVGIQEWRERLQYEMESNDSGYFKKRKNIQLPANFPDRTILDYYVNPAVTEQNELKQLETKWTKAWEVECDIPALRAYTAETLDWMYKPGAWKFVRVIAPALLANRLRRCTASPVTSSDQITERRRHFDNDGISELRITAIPSKVVGLDLDAEEDSPEYLARLADDNDDDLDQEPNANDEEVASVPTSPRKKRKTPWLPWNPEKMWIPETIVEIGAKEHAATWNKIQWDRESDAKEFAKRKCQKKKAPQKPNKLGGMQAGAIHNYAVATKPASDLGLSRMPESHPKMTTKDTESTAHGLGRHPRSGHELANDSDDRHRSQPTAYIPLAGQPISEQHQSILSPPRSMTTSKAPREDGKALADDEVLPNVTQRTPKRRAKKNAILIEPQPPDISPRKEKRRIESFFKPYIRAEKTDESSTGPGPLDSALASLVVPLEPSTGLATTLATKRHLHVVPRTSLPGTWKELETDTSSSSRAIRAATSRPPRVSIIGLTVD